MTRTSAPWTATQPPSPESVPEGLAHMELLGLSHQALKARLEGALTRYQRLFSSLPLPALVVDAHGFIHEANQEACSLMGLSRHAALYRRSVLQLFDPESRAKIYWRLNERNSGADHQVSGVRLTAGGLNLYCDAYIVHLDDQQQPYLQSLVAIVDRSLEEALAASEDQARQQTRRLSEVIWATEVGTWEWHLTSLAFVVNERFAELLGYSVEELQPLDMRKVLHLTHPDDRHQLLAQQERHRKREIDLVEQLLRMQHRSGSWRWMHLRGRVVEWSHDEEPLRASGTMDDVTAEQEQAEALRAARETAEAALKARSDFLSMVSHEIRTPMNAIVNLTQSLAESPLNEQQHMYVDKVQGGVRMLLGLVNDLLDHARLEAGKLKVESIPMRLPEVVTQVVTLFSAQAADKGLTLSLVMQPDVPEVVMGDPLRLGQVLSNLIGNAVKFTPYGGVVVNVSTQQVDHRPHEVLLRVEVQDSGVGLTPEQAQRLFSPFEQADSSTTRRFGGTGLGLSIARQLVELMQGHIGLDSRAGQGSVFWFTCRFGLPGVDDGAQAAAPPPVAAPAVALPLDARLAQGRELSASQLSEIRPILYSLEQMLDRRQARARVVCAEAQRLLEGTCWQADFVSIGRQVTALRFDHALRLLRELLASPPWNEE